jgi:hypothetical protein
MESNSAVLPLDIGTNPRELLELVGLPTDVEHAPKRLSGSANELIRSIVSVIDGLVLRALKERTPQDFARVRSEVFPHYFAAMFALGSLIRIAVPNEDVEILLSQSLSELESDFREHGTATFGADLTECGIFTVWTLRKINDLAQEVVRSTVEGDAAKTDNEMAKKFSTNAMWARFHIDCLIKSMHTGNPIFPSIVDSIVDGLRAAVNAYAWIKQGVDLRLGEPEPDLPPVRWTADDEALLSDSMRDMGHEKS